LVAGWDVCLMPFALNEATRFISPTKTLEYMAAGKPIVSTGINDVKAMFSDVVRIADDAPAFVDACRAALAEKGHQRTERLADMQACVWRYAWSQTVDAVHRALQDELTVRPAMAQQPAAARQPGWATAVEPQASKRRATAGLSLEPRIQKEPRCLPLPLSEVFCLAASAQHRAFLLEATKAFITEAEMARAPRTGGGAPKVAILWDPNEEHKPSNEEALHRFVEAAPSVGLAAELIGPDALDRLPSSRRRRCRSGSAGRRSPRTSSRGVPRRSGSRWSTIPNRSCAAPTRSTCAN